MNAIEKIGLGTFPLTSAFTPIATETASEIISTFLNKGCSYIATAPTYAFGKTEELIAQVIKKYPREKIHLSTACGYRLSDGKYLVSGRYDDVISSCNESLQRLQLDYIDSFMSQLPDPNTPLLETIGAIEDLQKQGKVGEIGVANVNLNQLKEYNSNGTISYIENRFSLLNRAFDEPFLDYCKTHNIKIVAYQVIDRGLLTNKVVTGISLREGDLRNKKPEFVAAIQSEIGVWVKDYLFPLANGLGVNVSALSIWWALQQPQIGICQIGATNTAQLLKNIKASEIEDSSSLMSKIETAYCIFQDHIFKKYSVSIREFMGLENYDMYKGFSASGK